MTRSLTGRRKRSVALCAFAGAACLLLFRAGRAAAAEQSIFDLSLEELSRMVVTDAKIPQNYGTVTQEVQVLPGEKLDLQTGHNRNVSELLQYSPGQFVNVLSRNDANWGSYGGLGPKYNGYFLDGLPIDSFVDAMSLDPWAFERIELYEGPASVMYPNYLTMDFAGNETPLGGITNIILKDRVEAPATRLRAGGGSYGTFTARFYHQDVKGGFSYFAGANYEHSDYTDYGSDNSWLNIIKDPQYLKTKLYAKVNYRYEGQSLSVFAHHAQHTGDAGRPNRDFNNGYDTVNAAYTNQLAPSLSLQLKTGYRGYDRRSAEDNFPVPTLREHDGTQQRIYPSDLTFSLDHGENGLLTFGADYQAAVYRTYAEVNGVKAAGNKVLAYSEGLFVQDKLVLGDWVLRAGGRFSDTRHHYDLFNGVKPADASNSWNKFLWSAGLRRNAGDLSFFANSGSGMAAPSAKQLGGTLFAADAGVAGKNGQLPSPGLKAENGVSSDLGVEYEPGGDLTLGARVFYSRLTDAIIDSAVSASPSQTRSANAGKMLSRGVELSAAKTVTQDFAWFANLTNTATRLTNSSDADQDGVPVPFVPYYAANAGVAARFFSRLTVAPYLHVVGRYYDSASRRGRGRSGPYQVTNIKLLAELCKTDGYSLRAGVDLDNVFNRRYQMPWQFQDPGFAGAGYLELEF